MALDFVAGLLGGVAGVLVGHPFDTVKVRLQTQSAAGGGKYKGTIHCFVSIAKQESVFGLYKGISSPLAGLAFINALVFGVYGNSLKYFSSIFGDNLQSYFCAGGAAGLFQSVICSPMEMAKLKLQLQGQGVWARHIMFYNDPPLRYAGPVDCMRKIYKADGFRGIGKGLPMTVLRDGPCFGIYFASYEWLTRSMTPTGPESLTTANLLFAGGAAGMISWLALYPMDVIKSRYQADDKGLYLNGWDCAKKSYNAEGYRVFTRGLTSALLRAFPTNAVTFFTVEWVFRLANGYLLKNVKTKTTQNESAAETSPNFRPSGPPEIEQTPSWLFFSLPDHHNTNNPTVLESAMLHS